MKTGVFFHPLMSQKDWPIMGNKFRRFPQVMERQLNLSGVRLFTPKLVSEELLLKVHTRRFVEGVKRAWYYDGASLTVGGCVAATERLLSGELDNALVFLCAAGHHAGRDSAWGGTYISCARPAVVNAREKFGQVKVAILDTDAHHGNGTRELFLEDKDALHVCFCSWGQVEGDGNKVCVSVDWGITDAGYLKKVRQEFIERVRRFKPDFIWHNLGHDTCEGDYGDLGLSQDFFPQLVREVKECAQEVCGGKYLVLTHGGCRADVAEYIFPQIIEVLAE